MQNLSKSSTALFRVHSQTLMEAASEGSEPNFSVVQDLFLVPLNSIVGRATLKPAHEQQRVVGPSGFTKRFHEKQQDYFDQEVSRRHCTVEVDDAGFVRIRDLASTNGTWLRQSTRTRKWTPLAVGRSYRLEPGNRILLGEKSRFEYEFLGLSSDAYIRVRLCSNDNLGLIDMDHWEWKALNGPDLVWSTRDHRDSQGRPYHGSPHFEVRLSRNEDEGLVAELEFEPSRNKSHGLLYRQQSGHVLHGAEIESVTINSDTQEREVGSEEYKVVYELALPGPDKDLTTGTNLRLFLGSRTLCVHHSIDAKGWPQTAKVCFGRDSRSQSLPFVDLHFRVAKGSGEVAETKAGDDRNKSFRHAFVRALLEQRTKDMESELGADSFGWVDLNTIKALLGQDGLTQSRFRSSVYRWRNDLQHKLMDAASRFQLSNITAIAIADEEDWICLEESQTASGFRFRLLPEITCVTI